MFSQIARLVKIRRSATIPMRATIIQTGYVILMMTVAMALTNTQIKLAVRIYKAFLHLVLLNLLNKLKKDKCKNYQVFITLTQPV